MANNRLRHYKNKGMDSEELRRRREEEGIQLRKQKRDQQLSKRRNVTAADAEDDLSPLQDSNISSTYGSGITQVNLR